MNPAVVSRLGAAVFVCATLPGAVVAQAGTQGTDKSLTPFQIKAIENRRREALQAVPLFGGALVGGRRVWHFRAADADDEARRTGTVAARSTLWEQSGALRGPIAGRLALVRGGSIDGLAVEPAGTTVETAAYVLRRGTDSVTPTGISTPRNGHFFLDRGDAEAAVAQMRYRPGRADGVRIVATDLAAMLDEIHAPGYDRLVRIVNVGTVERSVPTPYPVWWVRWMNAIPLTVPTDASGRPVGTQRPSLARPAWLVGTESTPLAQRIGSASATPRAIPAGECFVQWRDPLRTFDIEFVPSAANETEAQILSGRRRPGLPVFTVLRAGLPATVDFADGTSRIAHFLDAADARAWLAKASGSGWSLRVDDFVTLVEELARGSEADALRHGIVPSAEMRTSASPGAKATPKP
ncbi:MAG: hypothetical protein ACKO5K_16430 [Armatimonadota bacterium]